MRKYRRFVVNPKEARHLRPVFAVRNPTQACRQRLFDRPGARPRAA